MLDFVDFFLNLLSNLQKITKIVCKTFKLLPVETYVFTYSTMIVVLMFDGVNPRGLKLDVSCDDITPCVLAKIFKNWKLI